MGPDLVALLALSLCGVLATVSTLSIALGGFILSVFGITVPMILVDQAEADERRRRRRKLATLGLQPSSLGGFVGLVEGHTVRYRVRHDHGELPRFLHCWGVEVPTETLQLSVY